MHGGIASRTLFATLGVTAFRGRLFLVDDDNGPSVAGISYALWTQRFHQSPEVLGKTLTPNDKPFKVVGILPSGFSYRVLDSPHDVEVWTLIQAGDPEYKPDSVAGVAIVGRLKPGATLNQARSEITLLKHENDRHSPNILKSTALLDGLQRDNTRTVRSSLIVLGGAPVTVSLPVLAAAALLTVLSGLIFGAYPAFRAARLNVNQALRSGSSGTSAGAEKLRSRNILVLTQIALSVILLIGVVIVDDLPSSECPGTWIQPRRYSQHQPVITA